MEYFPRQLMTNYVRLCLDLELKPYDITTALIWQVKNHLASTTIVNRVLTGHILSVLTMRYGLGGGEPLTLAQAAERSGRSRTWVRNMEQRGLQHLRRRFAPGVRTFDWATELALELGGWIRKL